MSDEEEFDRLYNYIDKVAKNFQARLTGMYDQLRAVTEKHNVIVQNIVTMRDNIELLYLDIKSLSNQTELSEKHIVSIRDELNCLESYLAQSDETLKSIINQTESEMKNDITE
jgi:hypothetical protein